MLDPMRIVVLVFVCLGLAAAPGQADVWWEAQGPHFTVVSNRSDKAARAVALHFEQVRAVVQQVLTGGRVESGAGMTILAVKNEATLRQVVPHYAHLRDHDLPAGLFGSSPLGEQIVVRLDMPAEQRFSVIYHEYFHSHLDENAPGLPVWLDEGLAGVFETLEIQKSTVNLGRMQPDSIDLLQRGLMPLETLFAVDRTSPMYNESDKATTFYAQSWALAHYLVLGEESGTRRAQLDQYVQLVQNGVDPAQAAPQAFGDLSALLTELNRYVSRGRIPYTRLEAPEMTSKQSIRIRQLSAPEVAAQIGSFLVFGGHVDAARPFLAEALAADPVPARAHEAEAFLHLTQGDYAGASTGFAAALEQDEERFYSHFGLAITLQTDDDHDPDVVEQHLVRASELAPHSAIIAGELSDFYRRADPKPERAYDLIRKATSLAPDDPAYRVQEALMLHQMFQPQEAVNALGLASRLAIRRPEAHDNSEVCIVGALMGYAVQVMPNCDYAVNLAPENGFVLDRRGIARSLSGDLQGAAADFRASILWATANGQAALAQSRERWIGELDAGRNPIVPQMQAGLLDTFSQ